MSAHGPGPATSVCVVSHRQGPLVGSLLDDIEAFCTPLPHVVVVVNVPEDEGYLRRRGPLSLTVVRNETPRGFGANQNAGCQAAHGDVFVVVNPDVRLTRDPLPALAARVREAGTGVCAPMVLSPSGTPEDSARRFPTFGSLLRKAVRGARGPDYDLSGGEPREVDWVAGIFLAMRRELFLQLGGFDERYFMYYEDVDLCQRVADSGLAVTVDPSISVVHDARRASHRDLRHFGWHLRSVTRYLWRRGGRVAASPGLCTERGRR